MSNQIYPTNTAITYGYISSYLAQVDVAKQLSFNGGSINSKLPIQILMATKTIEEIDNIDPIDPNIPKCVNYLVSLCGKYIAQAQNISGSGGTVNPATGKISTIAAIEVQFTIGSGTPPIDPNTNNPIISGGTQFIIPYTYILNKSVGIVYNNVSLPINISTAISYTITYTADNAVVTMNQGVSNGDLFVVTGLQYVNI